MVLLCGYGQGIVQGIKYMPNKRFETDRPNRCALSPAAQARRYAARELKEIMFAQWSSEGFAVAERFVAGLQFAALAASSSRDVWSLLRRSGSGYLIACAGVAGGGSREALARLLSKLHRRRGGCFNARRSRFAPQSVGIASVRVIIQGRSHA
jgi:hypothetical protein